MTGRGLHQKCEITSNIIRSKLRMHIPGIDLLTNIFVLKALGWFFPGISEVGRSSILLAERSSFFCLFSCST